MRGWLVIFGIVAGLALVGLGLKRIFAKNDSVLNQSLSPSPSSSSSESVSVVAPPPSPFVACESFWAKDGRVLGACGDGYLFEGEPDFVEGKVLHYHRSRGRRI